MWSLAVGCWSLAVGLRHFKTCHSERSEESRSLTSRCVYQLLVKDGEFQIVRLRFRFCQQPTTNSHTRSAKDYRRTPPDDSPPTSTIWHEMGLFEGAGHARNA